MKLKIKRIDKTLPLPEYKTKGAVAFDFYTRSKKIIKPGRTELLSSNLIIKVPKGYFLMIASRSSTYKRGVFIANGIGVLDQDYCGPDDEIFIPLYNFTNKQVVIDRGERIAQGLVLPIEKVNWREVEEIKNKSRGGLGTTGKK